MFPGAGVFFLSAAEGEQISFLFDCIVRGVSPSRGPFGLRPLLPGVCREGAPCLLLSSSIGDCRWAYPQVDWVGSRPSSGLLST